MSKVDDEGATWLDVTDELRETCGQLELGEIVHEVSFGMFEAMSAIEIGDPKMDSGMLTEHCKNRPRSAAHMSEQDGNVALSDTNSVTQREKSDLESGSRVEGAQNGLDKSKRLVTVKLDGFSNAELIGIIDELLACYVTWLDGSSPMQTVCINWYLSHVEAIRHNWLQAIVTAFRKLMDQTQEKVSQSSVYDEEEFQPNYGLALPRFELTEQRAASRPKEVEDELSKRIRAAKQRAEGEEDAGALQARVRFLRCFLLALGNVNKETECDKQLSNACVALDEARATLQLGWRAEERTEQEVVYKDDQYYQHGFDSFLNHRLVAAVIPRCASILPRATAYAKLTAAVTQLRVALASIAQLREDAEFGGSHYEALCTFLRWFTRTHAPGVLARACVFLLIYPSYGSPVRPRNTPRNAADNGELADRRFDHILSLPLFNLAANLTQLELTRVSLRTTTNPVVFNLLEQSASLASSCCHKRPSLAVKSSAVAKDDRIALPRDTQERVTESVAQLDEFLAQLSSTQFARVTSLCLNCARQHERLAHALDDLSVLQDDADRLDALFREALGEVRKPPAPAAPKGSHKELEPQESCFGAFVLLSTFECVLEHVQSSFELELYSHSELHYVFWFLSDILFIYMQQVLSMCERAFAQEFDRCAALAKRERKAGGKKHNHAKEREKDCTAQNSRELKHCMRQRMFAYAQQQLSSGLLRFISALAIDGRYKFDSFRFTDEETRFRNRFRFFGAHLLNSNQLYDTYRNTWLKLTDPQHSVAAHDCGCNSGHHSHEHEPSTPPTPTQLAASHYSEASQCFSNALKGFEDLLRDLPGADKKAKASASSPKANQGNTKATKPDDTQPTTQQPSLTDFWQLNALVSVARKNVIVANIFQRAAGATSKRVSFDFSEHSCYPVLKLF